MPKITPHLWFDTQAIEAAEFYTRTFPNSKIIDKTEIKDTPSGDCDIVGFQLMGEDFMAISAGPYFKINPSISFIVVCKTKEEVDDLWEKLLEGGQALMPLDSYPFSERYGWLMDKYGVTWQLILIKNPPDSYKIMPQLMFVQENEGKAAEAMKFYTDIFPNSKIGDISYYGEGKEPEKADHIEHGEFTLDGKIFSIIESALNHKFSFNEGISLIINCKDQEEIDYFWEKLSAVPESEQCGWVKDKYGVSWQIIPTNMGELMAKNPEKTTPAMLKMKKIIIADLEEAGK